MWGHNHKGQLGQNSTNPYGNGISSPVQVPGTTWNKVANGTNFILASKTDGTLWSWGYNALGGLGQNDKTDRSSPTQIPGTTWSDEITAGDQGSGAIKTDGTLWMWGNNPTGELGQNNKTQRSSPIQVPGTTWRSVKDVFQTTIATKTDGTLWSWGYNGRGQLGQNNRTDYSSPKQIPGTTWDKIGSGIETAMVIKTDGTLWTWGSGMWGVLGNNTGGPGVKLSSPAQIPGTTWSDVTSDSGYDAWAVKTDGTLWSWGRNDSGELGQNNRTQYSSPTQVGSDTDWNWVNSGASSLNRGAMMGKRY